MQLKQQEEMGERTQNKITDYCMVDREKQRIPFKADIQIVLITEQVKKREGD